MSIKNSTLSSLFLVNLQRYPFLIKRQLVFLWNFTIGFYLADPPHIQINNLASIYLYVSAHSLSTKQ